MKHRMPRSLTYVRPIPDHHIFIRFVTQNCVEIGRIIGTYLEAAQNLPSSMSRLVDRYIFFYFKSLNGATKI